MWIVLRGLRGTWAYTFGTIFGAISGVKIGARFVGHVHPFGFLGDLNRAVMNSLERAATGYEQAMGFWFHQSARLQGWLADETWKVARDTFHFGQWLVHSYVPLYVHGVTDILHGITHTLTKVVHVTETKIVNVTKVVKVEAKSAAHAAVQTVTRAVPIALAPPLAIPRVWHGIDELKESLLNRTKRLTKVEALLGATAMAAAMANVLGLRSARCLRDGNIGRAARAFCGLDRLVANALLADLALVAGTISIVEFAKALQKAEPLVAASLSYLVDDVGLAADEIEAIARRSLAVVESLA